MQFTPHRLERVQRSMEREGLDAIIITRRADTQYLTGHNFPSDGLSSGCIVMPNRKPILIVSDFQKETVAEDSVMSEIVSFKDNPVDGWLLNHGSAFWDCIVNLIKGCEMQSGIIGLQQDYMSVREFDYLKASLPKSGFRDFSAVLRRLRQIKDPVEIDAIRDAVSVAEIGMRTALEIVAAGKTEIDTSIEIEAAMRTAGGQQRGLRAAVLSGRDAGYRFAQPNARRIGSDDLVVIDIIVSLYGYFAEVSRTLHAGRPTKIQKEVFDTSLKTGEKIAELLTPGTAVGSLAKTVTEEVFRQRSSVSIIPPLGSSIGLDLMESPFIMEGSEGSIREGMVFSIHPLCYTKSAGSAKIADMYVITENGPDCLTSVARETL